MESAQSLHLTSTKGQVLLVRKDVMKLFRILIAIILTFTAPVTAVSQVLIPVNKPAPTLCAHPVFYAGYLSSNKPTSLSFDVAGGNVFGISSLKQTLNIQGIWTELFVPIKTSGLLGLDVGGAYLFPSNSDSEERYELTTGFAGRNWGVSSQLWNVQFAVTYDTFPSVTSMFGFRYQSFMVNFVEYKNPFPNTLVFNEFSLAGTDFSFAGYIPFLGARIERNLFGASVVRASAIGFPALPGSFLYREVVTNRGNSTNEGWQGSGIKSSNEFLSGYFLEAMAELLLPVSWWGQAGAFVKFSNSYGKTSMNLTSTIAIPRENGVNRQKSFHNDTGLTFEQSVLVVGGSLSIAF